MSHGCLHVQGEVVWLRGWQPEWVPAWAPGRGQRACVHWCCSIHCGWLCQAFGKAAGCLCPSVLMKDYAREQPAIAWALITLGLRGRELVRLVNQTFFFFFFPLGCVSFFLLKKKKTTLKKTPHTKVRSTPIVFLTISRQKLFGLKKPSCSWPGSYRNSSVRGWDPHAHFLPFPSCLPCRQHYVPICKTPSRP